MKNIKNLVLISFVAFLFASCTNGNPNDHSDMPNSTSSGSYSAGNNDSTSVTTPIPPSQPNGMDTTGEQTNRMNNPASGSGQQKNTDSSQPNK